MKSYVALIVCLMSLTVAAQQRPASPARPVIPSSPGAPAPPPTPPADLEGGGQPINIRLDVSVIDQTAQAVGQPKSLKRKMSIEVKATIQK
ncbi:MAG TPA: hypothetical protein VM115_01980 [Vicinamibacterales bacterium]|nr:hypothetical protein [Vicinamibacterales bacterium]